MKLFHLPLSPFSARVRVIAAEKGLNVELAAPTTGAPQCPGLAAVHPLTYAPVLIHETLALSETNVISEFLEERYRNPPMLPEAPEDRATVRSLVAFHDNRLGPAICDAYSTTEEGMWTERDVEHVRAQLWSFERRIRPGPWLGGAAFGIADATYCVSVWYAIQLAHRSGRPLDEAALPRTLDWFSRASSRPSVALAVGEAERALAPRLVSNLCDPRWFGPHLQPSRSVIGPPMTMR